MPAGKNLVTSVEIHLDPELPKTIAQIAEALSFAKTQRAIRYAMASLLGQGKAVRHGRAYLAAKDLIVDIFEIENGPATQTAVPLEECFPGDVDGYLAAKADLLHHGKHTGGGGAWARYFLRLTEVA